MHNVLGTLNARQTDFYNRLTQGILTEEYIDSCDESIICSVLLYDFKNALLPFMVATRFKYKSLAEIVSSSDEIKIANMNKTPYDLLRLFLFEKVDRNKALSFVFDDTINMDEIKPAIDEEITRRFEKVASGNYDWTNENVFYKWMN